MFTKSSLLRLSLVTIDYSQKRVFAQKYVVQHIKKFAYVEKKQYLCSVKEIRNIF